MKYYEITVERFSNGNIGVTSPEGRYEEFVAQDYAIAHIVANYSFTLEEAVGLVMGDTIREDDICLECLHYVYNAEHEFQVELEPMDEGTDAECLLLRHGKPCDFTQA